ncbi:Alpha-D-kanosaminyltransferase [compost metagenome]
MFAARERCVGGSSLQTIVALTEFAYRRHVARDSDVVAKYLVPSMFLKNWSERAGLLPERLSYLPNFVSVPTPFRAARGEMVTYVGRLSEEKGLPTLISAASRLPDVRFQLVGDGPLRAELERLITKLGLSNVMLTGSLRDERLQEAFDRSCLLVLPSECFENAPMVILEAYSFGLPVIGSNRGGIPELVHNGQTGFLFEPGNADDLAEKVALVVGDPDAAQRMGEAGRALVVETFAEESHYQMLLSAYQEVLSAERAAPSLTGAR